MCSFLLSFLNCSIATQVINCVLLEKGKLICRGQSSICILNFPLRLHVCTSWLQYFLLQCEASILYSGDWRMESLSFMWLMPLLKYQQDQISTRLQNVTTDNPSGTQKLLYYNNLVYLVTISLVGRSLFCPFLAKEVEPGARRYQHLFRPWWHCILQSLLCLCARPISSEAFLLRSFSSLSLALGPGYHGLLCAPSLSLSRCVVKWKAVYIMI